jgi:hypothetical protein
MLNMTAIWFAQVTPPVAELRTTWFHTWNWPSWVTLFVVVLIGVSLVWSYGQPSFGRGQRFRWWLLILRGLSYALLLFMISQLALLHEQIELPHLIMLFDDSASMSANDQINPEKTGISSTRWVTVQQQMLQTLPSKLTDRYRPDFFLVSDQLRQLSLPQNESNLPLNKQLVQKLSKIQPQQQKSELGKNLIELLQSQRSTPPAAIVLLTDGINTSGPSLSEASTLARRLGVPIFIAGAGELILKRDLAVVEVIADDTAWVNDQVLFEVLLTQHGYTGQTCEIRLTRRNQTEVLAQQKITLSEALTQRAQLIWQPTAIGREQFQISIVPLPDEARTDNNQQLVNLVVKEQQLKVLLVADEPNYDFRFLKDLLQREQQLELKTLLQAADVEFQESTPDNKSIISIKSWPATTAELNKYDVIILADANPAELSKSLAEQLQEFIVQSGGSLILLPGVKNWPTAYASGALTDFLPVDIANWRWSKSQPVTQYRAQLTPLGQSKSWLQIQDQQSTNPEFWQTRLDPLYQRVLGVRVKPTAQELLSSISSSEPNLNPEPLVVQQLLGAGQVLFHGTDETWRWRSRQGGTGYARYWLQTIREMARHRWLSKEQPWRLFTDQKQFSWGELIHIRGKVPSAVNLPKTIPVKLSSNQETRRLLLQPHAQEWSSESLQLAPGNYTVESFSNEFPFLPTEFQVLPVPAELDELNPDFDALKKLAQQTQGQYYPVAELTQLWKNLPAGRPLVTATQPPQPIWNRWPFLLALSCLLIFEWWGRKKIGWI